MDPLWAGRLPRQRINASVRGHSMLDIFLLALGLGVFGLMAAYVAGCDRV
jgi:hypothetical protein